MPVKLDIIRTKGTAAGCASQHHYLVSGKEVIANKIGRITYTPIIILALLHPQAVINNLRHWRLKKHIENELSLN